jgi:hypothetical protein
MGILFMTKQMYDVVVLRVVGGASDISHSVGRTL